MIETILVKNADKNGVVISEKEMPIKETEIARGDKKGAKFYEVDWAKLEAEPDSEGKPVGKWAVVNSMAEAWGIELVTDLLKAITRQRTKAWTVEASTDENDNPVPFDEDSFRSMFAGFSARGESLDEMETRYSELVNIKMAEAVDTNDMVSVKNIMAQLKSLQKDIEAKKRKRTPKVAAAPEVAGVQTA